MRVHVLGSAAGGGFPQWNCACHNCRTVRGDAANCTPRTETSVAISADGQRWALLSVAAEARSQFAAFPPLWPRDAMRTTPVDAILLPDAELDATLGLLVLRPLAGVPIYCTAWTHHALTAWNPLFRVAAPSEPFDWRRVDLTLPQALIDPDTEGCGLMIEAISTQSVKLPRYAPLSAAASPETGVGYIITDLRTHTSLAYCPTVGSMTSQLAARLAACACVLFDGTCWTDDELELVGVGRQSSRAMGHAPITGPDGSLDVLAGLAGARRIYIHLNNTNPLLINDSPERHLVTRMGIEVAADGMDLEV